MKTLKLLSGLALLLMLCGTNISRAGEDFTKKIHQDFTTNENTTFEFSNKYGDVNIKDWDKKMITIDITIKIENTDKSDADDFFKNVNITFSNVADVVKAVTDFEKSIHNEKFSIDWEVSMPKNIKLNATNKYGNLFINEMTGYSIINVKYGTLKVNKLLTGDTKPRSEVNLGYSNGSIKECNWLKLSIEYSKIDVDKSDALIIVSKYSKLNIDKCNSIVCESKYDTPFKVGTVRNFVCEGKYSSYKIEKLSGKLDINAKYSDIKVDEMDNEFESATIDLSYGQAKINFSDKASYQLKAYANYGDIHFPDNENISQIKNNSSTTISGTVGTNKSTKAFVNVNARYSDVNLKKSNDD